MQRAKTILYLEQKLPSSTWQQYCEYIQKECSPKVSSLSEEMCLGRRDKKRTKEKLIRNVDEIHAIMSDRFGQHVGTKTSDIDKLLTGINKLNGILTSQAQYSATIGTPGSINLNIILDPRSSLSPIPNGVASKREELSGEKVQCDKNQNLLDSKRKTDTENMEQDKKSPSLPSTSSSGSPRVSDDEKERSGVSNQSIQRQLDVILNLMKETIKNGRVNCTLNGRALVRGATEERESLETLLAVNGGNNTVQTTTALVDRASNVQADQGIMNRACSPVLAHDNDVDDTRHSSLDLYTSDDTPLHSPNYAMEEGQPRIDFTERLHARYEGSSFLSTSSADGNTTCDENGYTSSQISVASISNNTNQKESPNSEESKNKMKPNQTKRSHRRIQPPKTHFLCAAGGNHGSSSESDVSSHECKAQDKKEVAGNRPNFVCEDDFSSSSQGTDMTDQSCDNDSHVSGADHYASTDICILSYGTSPEHDSSTPQAGSARMPQVRWADTASEPGSTPFLNIWEISPTTSDHFSGEIQVESDNDTATGDEGHSGSEGNNKGQQTDV